MTREESIIELGDWLGTPPGRCLLQWEQDCLDHAVADLFGFHALQLGLPEMDGLRTNRMPHRWVATERAVPAERLDMPPPDASLIGWSAPAALALHCQPEALPFPDRSLDLVLLPHTLELAQDPHLALAEASRVLRPEGRVVIVGLNPMSLWALRQRAGQMRRGFGRGHAPLYLPRAHELIGYWRLRDWLRLLSFDVEQARFGCYRPPFSTQAWLDRSAWMEGVGERWWPVMGSVYFLQAVKRVQGLRLVGLSRERLSAKRAKPAPAAAVRRASERTKTEA